VSAFAAVLDPPRPVVRRVNGRVPPPEPPTGGGDDDDRDPSPRRGLENAPLATMFLIAGEVMFFAGLISAYLVLRMGAAQWPPPLQPRLPLLVTGLNTLVLLGSSLAMVRTQGDRVRARVVRGLTVTAALGIVFLTVQGYEWVRLVSYGLTMTSGAYGATFYTLIGVHALHVVGALVWLAIVRAGVGRGRFLEPSAAALRACAMYWHFVVALWPVLYVTVYLL
jgi:heme/copper-type cytochrome/quinol oxidase subunit 3